MLLNRKGDAIAEWVVVAVGLMVIITAIAILFPTARSTRGNEVTRWLHQMAP